LIRSGWSGDADRGDGCADSARALRQGRDDPGNCTGPQDIPEYGPQSVAIGETSFEYERNVQPRPKLGRWTAELDELLEGNAAKAAREQLTLIRIFEELRERGYDGGYDALRRYARRWAKRHRKATAVAYVPLSFAPGEAYQFDWSHEVVLLSGVTVIVKVAHVRLCHSRMLFVRAYAKAHHHPDLTGQTIWEVFEAERPKLVPYAGRFDGFHAVPASVSKTCLVRFDNNKYSVAASAVGCPVEVHAYADRIVIRQDGRIVGEHPRSFGRGETIYDPWHYVPVLARKPGALRNGAPFKDSVLPTAMERVRRKLAGVDDGNRQMVDILTAVLTDGLPAVEAACSESHRAGRPLHRRRPQHPRSPA
jgi:hypothetical protein